MVWNYSQSHDKMYVTGDSMKEEPKKASLSNAITGAATGFLTGGPEGAVAGGVQGALTPDEPDKESRKNKPAKIVNTTKVERPRDVPKKMSRQTTSGIKINWK
jgi:hypothetical protein